MTAVFVHVLALKVPIEMLLLGRPAATSFFCEPSRRHDYMATFLGRPLDYDEALDRLEAQRQCVVTRSQDKIPPLCRIYTGPRDIYNAS